MLKIRIAVSVAIFSLVCMISAVAQQQTAASAPPAVPTVVHFSGTLASLNGQTSASMVGVTFCLYNSQQGGSPLWIESQNVQLDRNGRYNVSLGTEKPLPVELFSSGEARYRLQSDTAPKPVLEADIASCHSISSSARPIRLSGTRLS